MSAKSIKLSNQELIEKFESLNPGLNNSEFIEELLKAYELLNGKNCSLEPQNYFPNLQGKDKSEKEPVIKNMFGLEDKDPLLMSECELLEKASEYSGKSIAEMSLEGRLLVAKNEIGRQVQYALGKGKKGCADERLEQTYNFMKESGQKLSINRLTQLSGSNRKTVESWIERNNISFE
jgi:hypothetical protein